MDTLCVVCGRRRGDHLLYAHDDGGCPGSGGKTGFTVKRRTAWERLTDGDALPSALTAEVRSALLAQRDSVTRATTLKLIDAFDDDGSYHSWDLVRSRLQGHHPELLKHLPPMPEGV